MTESWCWSKNCHQCISSQTSVTNIDVTQLFYFTKPWLIMMKFCGVEEYKEMNRNSCQTDPESGSQTLELVYFRWYQASNKVLLNKKWKYCRSQIKNMEFMTWTSWCCESQIDTFIKLYFRQIVTEIKWEKLHKLMPFTVASAISNS